MRRPPRQPLGHPGSAMLLVVLAVAGACAEVAGLPPGRELQLEAVAGHSPGTLPILSTTAEPPVVRVTDASGAPVAGVSVHFSPTKGAGAVAFLEAVTGADGTASAGTWTFGHVAGPQEVVVSITNVTSGTRLVLAGTATPGPTTRLTLPLRTFNLAVGGEAQLTARPADAYRNPTGAPVAATYVSGHPVVASVSADGLVTAHANGAARIVANFGADADTVYVGVGHRPLGLSTFGFLTPQAPWAVAITAAGDVLAVGDDRLYRYSAATGATIDFVTLGGSAVDIAITADGTRAVVADPMSGALRIISLVQGSVERVLSDIGTPIRVAITPDGAHAYVGTTATGLARVELATGQSSALALAGGVNGVEMDAARGVAYVSTLSGQLHEVALASFSVLRTVDLGGKPQGVAVAPGGRIFVANEVLGVQVVETTGFTLEQSVPAFIGALDLSVTHDGMEVYVSRPTGGDVAVMHALTFAMLRSYVRKEPRRMAAAPDGRWLAVADVTGGVFLIR